MTVEGLHQPERTHGHHIRLPTPTFRRAHLHSNAVVVAPVFPLRHGGEVPICGRAITPTRALVLTYAHGAALPHGEQQAGAVRTQRS
jgi:hypothetical protein